MRRKVRWKVAAGTPSQHDHMRFAFALYSRLAEAGGNACFSPYSAASALGLTAMGAAAATRRELLELLAGSGELENHLRLLADAGRLDGSPGGQQPILEVANTLWAWEELPIREEFRAGLDSVPSGSVRPAPFVDDPEAARQRINSDVAERTKGLIPELVPAGAVDEDTAASLVNALYLRVAWESTFDAADTTEEDFHAPGGTVRVPMMAQTAQFGYAAREGWQAVGIPAVGGVEAAILLPDGDLAEQEKSLDVGRVERLLANMTEKMMDLRLPRFRLDVRSPLTTVLRDLGVRELFTRAADLSGISDGPLFVDSVQHQAVLRVDEKGVEGAAATAGMMRLIAHIVPGLVLRVDRPFLLVVRNPETRVVYFLARVAEP